MNKSCIDCKNYNSGWCTHYNQYITSTENLKDYYYGTSADARNCYGFDPKSSGVSSGSSGCFLTSACVQYKGLADDCEELTVLRGFRDGYMQSFAEGRALVKQYYEIAPAIVKNIDKSQHANACYEDIYQTVRLCVEAVLDGRNADAVTLYRAMVEKYKAV